MLIDKHTNTNTAAQRAPDPQRGARTRRNQGAPDLCSALHDFIRNSMGVRGTIQHRRPYPEYCWHDGWQLPVCQVRPKKKSWAIASVQSAHGFDQSGIQNDSILDG